MTLLFVEEKSLLLVISSINYLKETEILLEN